MAIYYVDFTTGDDDDSGLTEALAWKTVEKVNASTFAPDDSILFKCGERWETRLVVPSSGTAGHPITFGKYGTGDLPKIHTTRIINNGYLGNSWIQVGGAGHVWYLVMPTGSQSSFLLDGVRCTFVATQVEVTSDEKVYRTGSTYYVHTEVSGGPPNDSRVWEWIRVDSSNYGFTAIRCGTLAVPKEYLKFENLDLRGGNNVLSYNLGTVCLTNTSHFIIDNCTFLGSDGACITWYSGHDGTITNNTLSHAKRGVQFGVNSDVNDIDIFDISHNTVSYIGIPASDTGDTHAIGIYGSTGEIHNIGNGVISYNKVAYCGAYGNWPSIGIYSAHNIDIHHNNVHDNAYAAGIKIGTGCSYIDIYYNLIWKNVTSVSGSLAKGGIYLEEATGGPATHLYIDYVNIYNNTIYGNDSTAGGWGGGGLNFSCTGTAGHSIQNVNVKNNIVFNNFTSLTGGYELRVTDGTKAKFTNVVLDYNCYYRTVSTSSFIKYDVNLYSLAQFSTYVTNESQDANSMAADPLLVNGSGTWSVDTDFKILTGSPCKDVGLNVGLTPDYFGNSVPSGGTTDIGAHEYQGGGGEPEINITDGTNTIGDGGAFNFGPRNIGTNTDQIFTLENLGDVDLTLSGTPIIVITGTNADQFSVQAQPTTPIAGSAHVHFTLRFSPTSWGAKVAAIAIANNDVDENPYNITLNGIAGGMAIFFDCNM